MKLDYFQDSLKGHIYDCRELINKMPKKGDTEEDCQKLCLLNRLNEFEYFVNGVISDDLIKE